MYRAVYLLLVTQIEEVTSVTAYQYLNANYVPGDPPDSLWRSNVAAIVSGFSMLLLFVALILVMAFIRKYAAFQAPLPSSNTNSAVPSGSISPTSPQPMRGNRISLNGSTKSTGSRNGRKQSSSKNNSNNNNYSTNQSSPVASLKLVAEKVKQEFYKANNQGQSTIGLVSSVSVQSFASSPSAEFNQNPSSGDFQTADGVVFSSSLQVHNPTDGATNPSRTFSNSSSADSLDGYPHTPLPQGFSHQPLRQEYSNLAYRIEEEEGEQQGAIGGQVFVENDRITNYIGMTTNDRKTNYIGMPSNGENNTNNTANMNIDISNGYNIEDEMSYHKNNNNDNKNNNNNNNNINNNNNNNNNNINLNNFNNQPRAVNPTNRRLQDLTLYRPHHIIDHVVREEQNVEENSDRRRADNNNNGVGRSSCSSSSDEEDYIRTTKWGKTDMNGVAIVFKPQSPPNGKDEISFI